MSECEVCGKESAGKRAEIDGVILEVCDNCAKLGKEVYQPRKVFIQPHQGISRAPKPESIEATKELVPDFAMKIRKAREKANLTQDEAAMKMGLSHLIYKRIESGFKPDEATTRKIERFFGINLYKRGD